MREFLLGIQPFPQPSPHKNPGGDCFACALTAALRHLFPERPLEFEVAWNYFMAEVYKSDQKQLNNTWPGMRRAMYQANSDGYRMSITSDIVRPNFDAEKWSHAWFQFVPVPEYTRRLEAYLRAGWVAVAEINYAGVGPSTPDGKLNGTDHFVLLDGVKWEWVPFESGGGFHREYVHVVCSAKGPYWIQTHDFLVKHGAAGWWLVRREEET
jgi:hypothetical protein